MQFVGKVASEDFDSAGDDCMGRSRHLLARVDAGLPPAATTRRRLEECGSGSIVPDRYRSCNARIRMRVDVRVPEGFSQV